LPNQVIAEVLVKDGLLSALDEVKHGMITKPLFPPIPPYFPT